MKTGAPVLPFSFSDLDARQSGDVWANVGSWHIASFRCDAEFGRYRGKADIDQAAPIKLDL
jgi:hypothetical protein